MALTRILIFLISVWVPPSFACVSGAYMDVYFEKNSSTVSPSEIRRLAKWVTMIRQTFKYEGYIITSALTEQVECNHQELGQSRELAVRMVLIDLGFTPPTVYRTTYVEVIPPGAMATYGPVSAKKVEIDFKPGCPESCGICPQ